MSYEYNTRMIINELTDIDQWDAIAHIQELVQHVSELQSRLESLEKDAARWRWLKNKGRCNDFRVEQEKAGWVTTHSANSLDEAIDTAMQSEKGCV